MPPMAVVDDASSSDGAPPTRRSQAHAASPGDDDDMEETPAAAIAKAFHAARNGDAERVRLADPSSSSSAASSELPRWYAVPRGWMDDFLAWIGGDGDDGAGRPGEIENAPLIKERGARSGAAGIGGGAGGGGGGDVTTAPASGLLGDVAGGGGGGGGAVADDDDDDDLNLRERLERRRRWRTLENDRRPALRPDARHGADYVLVGAHVWQILSAKFGYDVCVPLPSAPLPNGGGGGDAAAGGGGAGGGPGLAVELRPAGADGSSPLTSSLTSSTSSSGARLLPVPASGMWDYGEALVDDFADDAASDRAMAAGDEDSKLDVDDLFHDADETDASKLSSDGESGDKKAKDDGGVPVLLLPPSTTSVAANSATKSTGHQLAMVSLDENRSRGGSDDAAAADPAASPCSMDYGDDDDADENGGVDGGRAAIAAAIASRKRPDSSGLGSGSGSPPILPSSPSGNKRKRKCASGLGNLGNTCFMNSTLQCLAHTGPLRRYFVTGEYARDLNRGNPLGTGGELATEFAKLLCQMWGLAGDDSGGGGGGGGIYGRGGGGNGLYSGSYDSGGSSSVVYPRDFKYTLGRHAEQFMGYDQHDSQELATFLIDALHEDTNRVTKKPYVEKPEQGEGETDDDAAEKAWTLHLRREDSRVLESFMGQVKSRVQCPRECCGRVSTTFDPFIFLSVPIPGATDRTLTVTYVPLDPTRRMNTLRVTLSKTSSIATMQRKVVAMLNEAAEASSGIAAGAGGERNGAPPEIKVEDICLADVWSHEIYTFYGPDDEIDKIRDSDFTYAFHLTSVSEIHQETKAEKGADGEASAAAAKEITDESKEPKRGGKRRPRTRLDLATITRLNRDGGWQDALERYLAQPLILMTMTNPNRTSHEERMAFHDKMERFVRLCRKCPDSVPKKASDDEEGGAEEGGGRPVKDSDFEEDAEDDNDDDDGSDDDPAAAADDDEIDEDGPSLAERSETSSTFRNVDTPRDLAVLEFCSRKFHQFCAGAAQKKRDKYKDGVLIQVLFKRHAPPSGIVRGSAATFANQHSPVSTERSFGVPLVMRISPRLTVHGLRELLGRRLSRAIKCHRVEEEEEEEGEDDDGISRGGSRDGFEPAAVSDNLNDLSSATPEEEMKVASDTEERDSPAGAESTAKEGKGAVPPETSLLCQVAMTYERKSAASYKSHTSYRKLGALLKGDDGDLNARKLSFATAKDEGEQDIVADLVGPQGTVQLHWPIALANKCFDDEEWERAEDEPAGDDNEEEKKEGGGGGGEKKSRKKQVDVLDCISKYCQIEQLEETEMWYCSRCKEHVRAWKQFHLYRAPPILIVHLKRFHYSASTHRRDKIDSRIDFPLRGLDLTREVMHWDEGEEPIYDCYAVSNHYGGLGGGHYTAYALNDDGSWCHFDDSRVTAGASENDVKSAAAYVLYYKRRDVGSEEEEEEDSSGGGDGDGDGDVGVSNVDELDDMDVDAMSGGSSRTCSSPMESLDGDDMEANIDEMESLVVRNDESNPQAQ